MHDIPDRPSSRLVFPQLTAADDTCLQELQARFDAAFAAAVEAAEKADTNGLQEALLVQRSVFAEQLAIVFGRRPRP